MVTSSYLTGDRRKTNHYLPMLLKNFILLEKIAQLEKKMF